MLCSYHAMIALLLIAAASAYNFIKHCYIYCVSPCSSHYLSMHDLISLYCCRLWPTPIIVANWHIYIIWDMQSLGPLQTSKCIDIPFTAQSKVIHRIKLFQLSIQTFISWYCKPYNSETRILCALFCKFGLLGLAMGHGLNVCFLYWLFGIWPSSYKTYNYNV